MITQTEIKAMSDHLSDALTKEDLGRRDAAKFLNLNPCYITMGMNPKFWDSMSKFAKDRIKEWHDSRDLISQFRIPQGEEIWNPTNEEVKKVLVEKKVESTSVPPASEVLPREVEKSAGIPVREKGKRKASNRKSVKKNDLIPDEKLSAGGNKKFPDFKIGEALPVPIRQKFTLDLEINLFINGQKILF